MTKFSIGPEAYEKLKIKVDESFKPSKRERDWQEYTSVAVEGGRVICTHELDADAIACYTGDNHFNVLTQTPGRFHLQQVYYDQGSKKTIIYDADTTGTVDVLHYNREGMHLEERRADANDIHRWLGYGIVELGQTFREPLRIERLTRNFAGVDGFVDRILHPLAKVAIPRIFEIRADIADESSKQHQKIEEIIAATTQGDA
jgi:hypothetical protein